VQRARFAGDSDAERKANEVLKERKRILQETIATIAGGLAASKLPADELQRLIKQIEDALRDAGIETNSFGENWQEVARNIEVAVNGIIGAADAMGILDDNTRKVLTGITNIAAGVGQIAAGGPAGIISGVTGIIGGLAGVAGGLFGGKGDEEREAQIEAMRRQREELERLTAELKKLGETVGPLTEAVQRVRDAFQAAAEAQGLPPGGPEFQREQAIRERDILIGRRTSLEAEMEARGDQMGREERERLQQEIDAVNQRIEALNGLLADYDAALKKIEDDIRSDLATRRAALTGNQDLIDSMELQKKHEQELADARAAHVSPELIAEIEELQTLEREALEERIAIAQRRRLEDEKVATLEAQGLSKVAAVTRLLLEHERQLEDARRRGADAAELQAIQERQLAQQRAFVDEFITGILRDAALRRGDLGAVAAIDQAAVAKQFADAQLALEKLRDAGLITEEEFLRLSGILKDELGPAMQAAADAALEAARDFEKSIDEEIEDLTDPEGKPRRDIQRRADAERKEAREKFTGEDLDRVLKKIDDWERLQLEALEKGGAARAGDGGISPADQASAEVQHSFKAFSETSVQGLMGIERDSRDYLREIRDMVRLYMRRAPVDASSFEALGGTVPRPREAERATPIGSRQQPVIVQMPAVQQVAIDLGGLDIDVEMGTGKPLNAQSIIDAIRNDSRVMLEIDAQLRRRGAAYTTSRGDPNAK
jgi:hypothetical protein